MRSLETLGVDEGLINTKAFRPASDEIKPAYIVQPQFAAIVGQLAASKQLACDCIVPFRFRRLDVYNNMSGPERNEVAHGILGANRDYANEYTVWNPGDTDKWFTVHLPTATRRRRKPRFRSLNRQDGSRSDETKTET